LRGGKRAPLGTPAHERLMLLELATDLQNWPARNLIFRAALDRAADIRRLAEAVLADARKPDKKKKKKKAEGKKRKLSKIPGQKAAK
jgi:hypothetical protein